MKKNMFPIVFIIIVGILIVYAGMPAYKESKRPVNQAIAKGRDAGGATIIQFVTNADEMIVANKVAKEIESTYSGKVVMQALDVSVDPDFVYNLNLKMPAYIIYDVDGNFNASASGILTKNSALLLLQSVHMH